MITFAAVKEHELIKGRPASQYHRFTDVENSLSLQIHLGVLEVMSTESLSGERSRDLEDLSDIHLQMERLGLLDSLKHADADDTATLLASYREAKKARPLNSMPTVREFTGLSIPKILPEKEKLLI